MTENEENANVTGIYSKFWRITLVVVSMLLIFVGPTYVPYAMVKVLKIQLFCLNRRWHYPIHSRHGTHAVPYQKEANNNLSLPQIPQGASSISILDSSSATSRDITCFI